MTDPDPSPGSESSQKSRGVMGGLFNLFRKQNDGDADGDHAETPASGELVSHAREFQDLRVEDVMQPRADIVAIEASCGFDEVVARFLEAEHSRMPVYKESLDDPVGVVHVKDIFKLLAGEGRRPTPEEAILQDGRDIVRKLLFVPPSMPAQVLLGMMRGRRMHMALVIDEFGGTDWSPSRTCWKSWSARSPTNTTTSRTRGSPRSSRTRWAGWSTGVRRWRSWRPPWARPTSPRRSWTPRSTPWPGC
jgi:hypothetical protein